MKLLFMGTPDFAVPSLRALQASQHEIMSVVTATDKPCGRGLKIKPSPVKQVAKQLGLPVLQPTDLKDSKFIEDIQRLNAELFVVVAFRILPPEVFTLPPHGTINLHASYLPKYRGAAPINWAIINGEKETGVTIIQINEKVDTGEIVLQEKVPIGAEETAGELHDRLATIGAECLLRAVALIESGNVATIRQTEEGSRAPKLSRELCHIQWNQPAETIYNLVRGLCPVPGAYTNLRGKMIKLYRVRPAGHAPTSAAPGEIVRRGNRPGTLAVATGAGLLHIQELQPEGKRRMSAEDFLRGHPLKAGDRFE